MFFSDRSYLVTVRPAEPEEGDGVWTQVVAVDAEGVPITGRLGPDLDDQLAHLARDIAADVERARHDFTKRPPWGHEPHQEVHDESAGPEHQPGPGG